MNNKRTSERVNASEEQFVRFRNEASRISKPQSAEQFSVALKALLTPATKAPRRRRKATRTGESPPHDVM